MLIRNDVYHGTVWGVYETASGYQPITPDTIPLPEECSAPSIEAAVTIAKTAIRNTTG